MVEGPPQVHRGFRIGQALVALGEDAVTGVTQFVGQGQVVRILLVQVVRMWVHPGTVEQKAPVDLPTLSARSIQRSFRPGG